MAELIRSRVWKRIIKISLQWQRLMAFIPQTEARASVLSPASDSQVVAPQ